jgi:hypothetical protein
MKYNRSTRQNEMYIFGSDPHLRPRGSDYSHQKLPSPLLCYEINRIKMLRTVTSQTDNTFLFTNHGYI